MQLEWDEAKRRTNLIKHKVDFAALASVFTDPKRVEIPDRRRDYGELRVVILCPLHGRLLHVTYTPRGNAHRIYPPARPIPGSNSSMSATEQTTRAIVAHDGRLLIEQPDGSFRLAEDQTDWAALDAMTEEDLAAAIASDPDDPGNDPAFWEQAEVVYPAPKVRVTMRLDRDILDFFRSFGRGYQTRMQAVLRCYVEVHRRRR